jgi:preprotein translocase subunit SecD
MLHFPRWKIALILGVCALGLLAALPNVLPKAALEAMPGWLPARPLHLGLDLRGGSHLLLEVDTDTLVKERLEAIVDSARGDLRRERIAYTDLSVVGKEVVVIVRDAQERERAVQILRGQAMQIANSVMGTTAPDLSVQAAGDGRIVVQLTEIALKDRRRAAIDQSIEIIRRRIDQTGTSEPVIQREGDQRIVVQLPGVDDPDRIKRLLGKTAKMTFRLVDDNVPLEDIARGRAPAGIEFLDSEERGRRGGTERIAVQRRVMVSGDTLTDAQATFQDNQPVVSFRFDSIGARRFGEATERNVGKRFAIVLDGRVISAPVIREPIRGGSGIISGSFTVQSANDLALLLRAGALPAPLKIVEERSVGPSLGADSIRAGVAASVGGLVLILIYMVMSYGLFFGGIANLALIVNLVLIVGVLSLTQASMTLPGIAGIVLTIGMAVDANVLIYERVREEIRSGKTPLAAMDAGYARAMTTIIDSNLTALITSVILFWLGSGPVKGFAVTSAIGIATSAFTAVSLSRMIVATWLRRMRPQRLDI